MILLSFKGKQYPEIHHMCSNNRTEYRIINCIFKEFKNQMRKQNVKINKCNQFRLKVIRELIHKTSYLNCDTISILKVKTISDRPKTPKYVFAFGFEAKSYYKFVSVNVTVYFIAFLLQNGKHIFSKNLIFIKSR